MNPSSHHFLCIVAGLCLATISPLLHAQSDYSARTATRMLGIGASFEGGISTSFALRDPSNNEEAERGSSIFGYRACVSARYPFSGSIGGMLSLGIDSRGLGYDVTDTTPIFGNARSIVSHTVDRISYFSITPGVTISIFYIGLNIGLPLSGSRTGQVTTRIPKLEVDTTANSTASFDDVNEKLNLMIEPRAGIIVPLLDNSTGWLGVSAIAGYSLNKVTKPVETNGQTFEDPHQLASFQLGLTWQFGVPGTGDK